MIVFRRVRWKNFLSTGNMFSEVQLDKCPTTLIVGKNGSGKSTVIDAITFALFNKPFRNISKPLLVNSLNKKECVVEIEFSIGTNNYLVRRGIKPSVFDIEVNGVKLDQEAASKDFQNYLETKILRLNFDAFTQIVILGSSSYVPFMELSVGDRRVIVEDLLGISIFSVMNAITKDRYSAIKKQLADTLSHITLIESKIEMQKSYIETLKVSQQDFIDKKNQEMMDITNKRDAHQDKVNSLQLELNDLLEKRIDTDKIQKKLTKMNGLEGQIKSNLSSFRKQYEFFEKNTSCPTCKQDITQETKDAHMKSCLDDATEMNEAIAKMRETMKELNQQLKDGKEISDKIKTIQSMISTEQTSITHCNMRMDSIMNDIRDINNVGGNLSDEMIKLAEIQDDLYRVSNERNKIEKTKRNHELVLGMLKDNGIKTSIVKHYLPVMNNLINQFLSDMNLFVNFTLDENFGEKIMSRGRDDFTYFSFSEGQKMRINLALLFTWREIAKIKNSMNTNLLFLDEVFESSLDGEGTDAFMKMLKSLGQNYNTFIISHKTDQLYDKFNHVIEFRLQNNFSAATIMHG